MTRPRSFEQLLETWLEDGPKIAPRDLLESVLIAVPERHQHRRLFGVGRRLIVLATSARVAAAIAAVVLVGVVVLALAGPRGNNPSVGGVSATSTPSPSPSATAAPSLTPAPTPTSVAAIGPCAPADLAARITLWDGAAGQRIAHVELTNTGSASCQLEALARPQLVDGHGSVLIDGAPPAASALLTIGPGGVLKTLVQDGNYCGPAPLAPVSVAFVLPNGKGRFVATSALSPTDLGGVPPCNGAPGSAGDIGMQPWAP
jgi:hypothetical protein